MADVACLERSWFSPPVEVLADDSFHSVTDPMGHRTRRFMLRVLDMAREFPYEGAPRRWRISDDMTVLCEKGHQHHPRILLSIPCFVDEHLPPNSIVLDPLPDAKPRARSLNEMNDYLPAADGMLPPGR